MRFILIVVIYCVGSFHLIAQQRDDIFEGYIIMLQGDTVRGSIREKSIVANSHNCDFRKHNETQFTAYSPYQIAGYGYGKFIYHSHAIDDVMAGNVNAVDRAFLQLLSNGHLQLYLYSDKRAKEYFLLQDAAGQLFLLESRIMQQDWRTFQLDVYKGLLRTTMNCGEIHKQIEKTSLTENSLTALFNAYNACMDPGFQPLSVKGKKAFSIRIGISASLESYGISFYYRGKQNDTREIMAKRFSEVDLNNAMVPAYGIFADMGAAKSKRFFFRIGYELPRVVEWTSKDTSKSTVNGKISSVPLTVFYNVGMGRIRIQPFLGIAAVFISNDKEVPIVYRFPHQTFYYDDNGDYVYGWKTTSYNILSENDIRDTTFSGSLGVKVNAELNTKLAAELGVRYSGFLGYLIGENGLGSSFNMLSTSIGLTYRLK
jgi:hypothetical protein